MATHSVQANCPVHRSFRVEQVAGLFDVPLEERLTHSLTVELPGLDEDWTVGAIVGPSGSGKTTLARAVYGDALYEPKPWPDDAAIIDCLGDAPIKQITRVLTAVGLGSVPTWLKPHRVLSTGERFRADLARALLTMWATRSASGHRSSAQGSKPQCPLAERVDHIDLLVIDEFTSTLDRTVAQTLSAALARLLRKGSGVRGQESDGSTSPLTPDSCPLTPLRLIVLTCHHDILPWLAPDWTLDLSCGVGVRPSGGRDSAGAPPSGGRDSAGVPPSGGGDSVGVPPSGGWSERRLKPVLQRGCLRRPPLRLAVRRVPQSLWPHFARHHYLAGGLAASATCYAAFWPEYSSRFKVQSSKLKASTNPTLNLEPGTLNSSPVAFCAALASLGWKKTKRITRLVTLPEFQGLGIAARLAETVADHERSKGNRVTITASHPAILAHCSRSPRWKYIGLKKTGSTRQRLGERTIACSTGRAVASFEFVGQPVQGSKFNVQS